MIPSQHQGHALPSFHHSLGVCQWEMLHMLGASQCCWHHSGGKFLISELILRQDMGSESHQHPLNPTPTLG